MGEVVVSGDEEQRMELGTEEEEYESTEEKAAAVAEKDGGSSEVVRWESFLPRTVLRVLLVEADDSTRQIISALLRKCNYRVDAVPDGLMAWETLKGRPHNIDLILTEVELPSISGYALLTLVMEHDICKNIPVIMMSSQDSISMVLKCMLKGAADFLIKPVRRNELRNLWQHVWRRQSLTSGHIPQNSPTALHKGEATSENNAASNHSSDYVTSSQKIKDYSEKGSDAETSCTSPYLEAQSAHMQNMQGLSQLKSQSASYLSNTGREKFDEHANLDKKSITPESKSGEMFNRLGPNGLFSGEPQNGTSLRLGKDHTCVTAVSQDKFLQPESNRGNVNNSHGRNDELLEPSNGAIDLIGTFDSSPKCNYRLSSLNDGMNKFEFTPQLELSLRRFYPSGSKNQVVDERHALNHSNASAFSRYNSKTLQPLFPTSASNCAEFKEEAGKPAELLSNQLSQNTNGVMQQHGATSSGNQIMTTLVIGQSKQTELAHPSPRLGPIPVSGVRFDNICSGYSHVLPPVYYTQSGVSPAWGRKLAGQREQSPFHASTSVQSNPESQNFEQNYRQSDETTNNYIDQNVQQQNNKEHVEEQRYGSPATGQSSTSSLCNGVANHNSSAHGSFCSGNEKTTIVAVAADKSAPENLNDGGLVVHDGFRGLDSHWSTQREAALTKFRMKRKERCYEKKVRYQSRKRLAEQRPRVKGQFVRQLQTE